MARPSYRTYGSASYPSSSHDPGASIWDDIMTSLRNAARRAWIYGNGRGRQNAWTLTLRAGHQVRRNMVRRRLFSLPHLLVGVWILVLLWGERWTFASKVQQCDWDSWEEWPPGATPHRLIFVADPQLIDPHSYPGRPWPVQPLTMRITDNYMSRSYIQVQKVLQPDTVMFLGDLFDGGREWKTAHGNFDDPEWAKNHRPAHEKKLLKKWNKKYGEKYWLQEYARFGRIFADNWIWGGTDSAPFQRGRKLISSLPGNHDLGFGAEVKLPVRNRFNAYFGETNRVDIIGNHTFVSVDTVSLSAGTSSMKDRVDLKGIYQPINSFLDEVKVAKRRAVQKELRFWRGEIEEIALEHRVEELEEADFSNLPTMDPGENGPDFPTILLTHVPLYRKPGTPCGPMHEHSPPAKPPKGQVGPVIPDHRNAISVSSGYQYQNVLSNEDSIKLIQMIGNVILVFSGDDHDYCELVHSPEQEKVHEITVKSFSMAMGVKTPGFQMVSLYNPIDGQGNPPSGSTGQSLQTHLCLLPNQLSMYMNYALLGVLTVIILITRAFLVPALKLQPFALEPVHTPPSAVLPVFKPKDDVDDEGNYDRDSTSSATSASNLPSARFSSTRTRAGSLSQSNMTTTQPRNGNALSTPYATPAKGKTNTGPGPGKWGWAQSRGPRIQIRRDTYYDAKVRGDAWRPASARPRTTFGIVVEEMWTSCWRVAWMAVLFYGWLTWRG